MSSTIAGIALSREGYYRQLESHADCPSLWQKLPVLWLSRQPAIPVQGCETIAFVPGMLEGHLL